MDIDNNVDSIKSMQTMINNGTIETGSLAYEEMSKLLEQKYENALAKVHKNAIYKIGDGRWKTHKPQICRKTRLAVLEELYKFYFDKPLAPSLNDVYEEAIVEYAKLVEQGHRSSNTLSHYKVAWKKYVKGTPLARKSIEEITYGDLYSLYSSITSQKAVSRSALRNLKTTIKYCFTHAMIKGYIQHNIASEVITSDLVCKETKHHEGYTREELEKLRAVLISEDSPYADIILFDTYQIARIGELESLKWEDVNFDKKTILLHSQIIHENGTYNYVGHTKTGKHSERDKGRRIVKLNPKALSLLLRIKETSTTDYIFVSESGAPLKTNKINEHLKLYCKKADIPYRSTHSFRASNITYMFDMGVAPTKIQVAAGHTDIRTTESYCRSDKCDEIDESIWACL